MCASSGGATGAGFVRADDGAWETLGLLYVDSGVREKNGADAAQLAETEQKLVEVIAERSSLAVANLKLREILRTQSIRDPLTNLYNRRYMEDSLDRELARATRKSRMKIT